MRPLRKWGSEDFPLLTKRFGFRGATLITLGMIWVGIGYNSFTANVIPGLIVSLVPAPLKFLLWAGLGIYATVVGLNARRWDDTYGFLALYAPPALYAALMLISAFLGWYPRGFSACTPYLGIIVLTVVVARWPEPAVKDVP